MILSLYKDLISQNALIVNATYRHGISPFLPPRKILLKISCFPIIKQNAGIWSSGMILA